MKYWIGVCLVALGLIASPAWAQIATFSEATLQNAAVATGGGAPMNVTRYQTVTVDVTIATTATVQFEASASGAAWTAVACVNATSGTANASTTTTGLFQCNVAGFVAFRANITSWAAGAVTVFGRATTALFNAGGAGGSGGDGAILDGVSGSIEATVFDFTNSNPLGVVLRDTNGDYVSVGGGSQYAEDAAETAGALLSMAGSVRRDTAASSATTTGDNATINTDATGRLWSNTELPDAAALADATANPTITSVGSFLHGYNGTTWDRLQVDGSKFLKIANANMESYLSRLLSSSVPAAPGAATATTGFLAGGTYNSTPVTLTNTQQSGIQLDANGYVNVNVKAIPTGSAVTNTTLVTGVTTNTTSSAVAGTTGTKSFYGQVVCSSGACTQTQEIYGDIDNDAANGVLLCTITLSGTPRDQGQCSPIISNNSYYYVVTTATTGTAASGEIHDMH